MFDFFIILGYNIIELKNSLDFKKGVSNMNLAKISSNGQITVPIEIRKTLGLKSGDKILFFTNEAGDVVLSNASAKALLKAQIVFQNASDDMDIRSEEDVQQLIDDIRSGER